ncbi:MAG: tRNA adenosine(34) deaminase TadA [Myxococcota bacterium]
MKHDKAFMREAMALADRAAALGDVPVGALVVHRGEVIARAFNRREAWQDPTAHAELIAMRRAAEVLGAWRLTGCTLFVTLEPCPMCAGAIVNARVPRVVYGAKDDKGGAARSVYALLEDPRLNHRVHVETCLAQACAEQLRAYFAELRA